MKIIGIKRFPDYGKRKQILLKMKFTLILLLAGLLQVSATSYSQATKLSLEVKGMQVSNVLREIELKSDFRFFYQREQVDVERLVDLNVEDKTVEEILNLLFPGDEIDYKIFSEKLILIAPKNILAQDAESTLQPNTVTGTVTNVSGEPLQGATVLVKGTLQGVITNANGEYTILNVPDDAALVFSFVGMITQEVSVGKQTNIDVTMIQDVLGIEEVVAIGYGTKNKEDVLGAIGSVKSEDLLTRSTVNFQQSLQGKVAGVEIIQTTGQPGGNFSIKLRSNPSFANAGVLYVVDGIPVNDDAGTPNGQFEGTGGLDKSPLNFINPNDIESISFLKDASAASIYGARAGAGVVLISTKRGKLGAPKVNYSTSYAIQKADRLYDLLDSKEYMIQRNHVKEEIWLRDNNIAPFYGNVDPSSIPPYVPYYNQEEIDATPYYPSALDEIQRQGIVTQHDLSISGGTEYTKYYISGKYFDQKGIFLGNDYKGYTGKINIDQVISERIKVGTNIIASNSNYNNVMTGTFGSGNGILTSAINWPANIPLLDENGNYLDNPVYAAGFNPLSFQDNTDLTNSFRFLASPNIEIKLFESLIGKMNFSYDQSTNKRNTFVPPVGIQTFGIAKIDERQSNTALADFTLNYNKSLGEKSELHAVAGYSYQKSNWEGVTAGNSNFVANSISYYDLSSGQAEKPIVDSYKREESWASYFARGTFNYDGKYLLQASIRRDGSTKFALNKKWGIFPAFSGGWIISNEKFMDNIQFIDLLKLRAGYGETGNSNFPGTAFEVYSVGGNWGQDGPNPIFGQNTANIGIFMTQAANPNLTWETASETNLGIDFNLFERRISASVDFYNKNIRNLISWVPFPADFTVDGVYGNAGKTRSTGYEVSVQTINIVSGNKNGFRWSSNFTFSRYLNYWVERSPNSLLILPKYMEVSGRDALFNGLYGYESDGLFVGEYGTAPDWMPNMLPGGIIIKDIANYSHDGTHNKEPDGIITDADNSLLDNLDPEYSFGIGNTFNYGPFSLNIYFYGMKKIGLSPYAPNNIYPFSNAETQLNQYGYNSVNKIKERWSFQNPNGNFTTGLIDPSYSQYQNNSSYWWIDASFLRCKNITLGYILPYKYLRNQKIISSLEFTVDVLNPFIITKYPMLDPELNQNNYFPNTKSLVFGLSVSF